MESHETFQNPTREPRLTDLAWEILPEEPSPGSDAEAAEAREPEAAAARPPAEGAGGTEEDEPTHPDYVEKYWNGTPYWEHKETQNWVYERPVAGGEQGVGQRRATPPLMAQRGTRRPTMRSE